MVASAVSDMIATHIDRRDSELALWQSSPDWAELLPDDRESILSQTATLHVTAEPTLAGMRRVLAASFDLTERLRSLGEEVQRLAHDRRTERETPEPEPGTEPPQPDPVSDRPLVIPRSFEKVEDIEAFIRELEKLREHLLAGKRVRFISQLLPESTARRTPPHYQ